MGSVVLLDWRRLSGIWGLASYWTGGDCLGYGVCRLTGLAETVCDMGSSVLLDERGLPGIWGLASYWTGEDCLGYGV
jgi:predicted NAD-dependent protein-ADP-ribosyltransferase YbiA (DUF1768 family)